ncbi:LamG domain-containing protein [bacterium]|nr:LamG domain-containing protein [bacterium]
MPAGLGDEIAWYCPSLDDSPDDYSGNGNNGIYTGGLGTTADTGEGGSRAYNLTSNLMGLDIPDNLVDGLTSYSYACWVKPSLSTVGLESKILGAFASTNTDSNMTIIQQGTALKFITVTGPPGGGTTITKNFESVLAVNTWVHLCVTVVNGSQGYYSGFINGIPFVFFEYLGASVDTGSSSLDMSIGAGVGPGISTGFEGLIDDVRLYDRGLSDSEVEHLAGSRAVSGRPTVSRVCIRKDLNYVVDTNKFSPCQPNTSTGQPPYTSDYESYRGYGFTSYTQANFRNRSLSVDTSLAGLYFANISGDKFRIDLPNGLGTYKVFSAHYDALSSGVTGWVFKDGSAGSTIATVTASTTTANYVDINNNSLPASGFDYANESFAEHEFVNSYMEVERDTGLVAGNGLLSAVWLEYIPPVPPPPSEVSVHIARVAAVSVDVLGNVLDKDNGSVTIAQYLKTSLEHRMVIDAAIPNTAGNPTIKSYLEAEAADDYVIVHMDQNTIFTRLRT